MFVLSILVSRSLQVRAERGLWQHSLVYQDVGGTARGFGASFEQDGGASGLVMAGLLRSARAIALLGTPLSARSTVDHGMRRDEAGRVTGRPGVQAP